MSRITGVGLGMLLGVGAITGCRTATGIKELPRVDLEVGATGGNRGFLVGIPPEAQPQKTTRQMFGLDVEVPTFRRPAPGEMPPEEGSAIAPPDMDMPDMSADTDAPAPSTYDAYVVQKGDSLWKIAARPEIYGKASHWRRIFDANRDHMKSPSDLKVGMTLKIPRGGEEETVTYHDKDSGYRK